MKHLSKRLIALALSVAMAATMTPATAQAAGKKTVTVSTQADLTKALATKGVSKIVVKTNKAVKFTVKKGKYSKKLEMNAPKATITNSGAWTGVTVVDAKSYTEKAKTNKIVVKDKKVTLTVAKGATAKSVTFAKKGASNSVNINGAVDVVTISEPSNLNITDNGSLKKVTVDAKTTVSLSGASDVKTTVSLTKKAGGSSVKSAVPVAVKASADVAIILKKGAEGSAVTVKSADAKVELTNSTKDTIEITKADGTKESVAAGEKTDTSKDHSEKEDDKKDEDKNPVAGGGGSAGGIGGGSGGIGGGSDSIGGGSSEEEDKTPSLTLDQSEVTLSKWDNGGVLTLNAVKKNIAGEIEWLSSSEGVVALDSGTITYQGNGKTTITASAGGIQATCVVTTTDKVISASGFEAAVAETAAGGTVTLGSDIAGNVNATWGTDVSGGILTIAMGEHKLNGSLVLKEKSDQSVNYVVKLTDHGEENAGSTIAGDFTVNLPHAHVENNICVQGNTNIEAVSNTTYQVKDKENKVLLKGPGKLDIQADKRIAPQVVVSTEANVTLAGNVKEVSVEKPAEITVDASAAVEKIEIKKTADTVNKAVTVKGGGTVTALEAKAPIKVAVATTELTASAPVVVEAGGAVSNVYVESDQASIALNKTATVGSLSVNSTSVSTIKIEGSGTVGLVDVTKAQSTVSVQLSEDAAKKITSVVATKTQKDNIVQTNSGLSEKVKIPEKIEVDKTAVKLNYFVGEDPVITGASIKIVYSDQTESQPILVTDKMLDLSAVQKDVPGKYTIKLSYAGISKSDFAVLTYVVDTIKAKEYIEGSLKKKVYTRGDRLDPTGVVVKLIYASGKTEQVLAGDDRLAFFNGDIDLTKTPLPVSSNDYAVEIRCDGDEAGRQLITVNPKKYTVKLNANESVGAAGRVEIISDVEEFNTLNDLKASERLLMAVTPSAIAHENRFWEFIKWTEVGDAKEKAYSWDTPIESDLDLIGHWDTVKSIDYVSNSMRKLTYTRGDAFDATGATIRLTYTSGKTKDITDTSEMKFTDKDGNEISTVSPARKGDYVINVMFDGKKAGSQTVKVEPVTYTVTLDPNENGLDKEKVTVQVEEFTSLNQLKAAGGLELSETPSATELGHSTWEFLKWVKTDDQTKEAYSWDTLVESDLNLVGCWDTIKEVKYVSDSMNKLTYTRKETFDPAGAKICLTYESGRTKEITDTSKMMFTDQNGMIITTVSPEKKGDYVINIHYSTWDLPAGSQTVKVNPIYYTVTLDPNEGGRNAETVKAEEFTTLNQLCSDGAIKLTETLKPVKYENRNWKFLGWGFGNETSASGYYSWDTPVEKNLSLMAEWSVNGLDNDKVELTVMGDPVKEDRIYSVQVSHVQHFLHSVSASSIYAEKVFVKYGIADKEERADLTENTTFDPDQKYEIVYYTEDGTSYNGGKKSIFVETKAGYLDIAEETKGMIWLNETKAEVEVQSVDYPMVGISSLAVSYGSITVTPKTNDGAEYNASVNYNTNKNAFEIWVYRYDKEQEGSAAAGSTGQKEEKRLPLGEYQVDFNYQLNPTYEQGYPEGPEYSASVTVTYDGSFDSKVNVGGTGMSIENNEWINLRLFKYQNSKNTVADYIDGIIPDDVELEYAVGLATASGAAVYKKVDDLSEITVSGPVTYTLRIKRNHVSNCYYIQFYKGAYITYAQDSNRNAVSVSFAERPTGDVEYRVTQISNESGISSPEIEIEQVIQDDYNTILVLNQDMIMMEQYMVEVESEGVSTSAKFTKSHDYHSGKYYVSNAYVAAEDQIIVQMEQEATQPYTMYNVKAILWEKNDNSWKRIPCTVEIDNENRRVKVTAGQSLIDKEIKLTIYGNDIIFVRDLFFSPEKPQDQEIYNADWLTFTNAEIVSDTAIRFYGSDAHGSGSNSEYMMFVRKSTENTGMNDYICKITNDLSGGMVVENLPLSDMKDKTAYYAKIVCWRDTAPNQKEFSRSYYISIIDGQVKLTPEQEIQWEEKTGVEELKLTGVEKVSDSALKLQIADDKNPSGKAGNQYGVIVRKFTQTGRYVKDLAYKASDNIGEIIVDGLPLQEMYSDKDHSYRILIWCCREEMPFVSEFSKFYYLDFTDGQLTFSDADQNMEQWKEIIGVDSLSFENVTMNTDASLTFCITDQEYNASQAENEYYVQVKKRGDGSRDKILGECYACTPGAFTIGTLPLDQMSSNSIYDSPYYAIIMCIRASEPYVREFSSPYILNIENGSVHLMKETENVSWLKVSNAKVSGSAIQFEINDEGQKDTSVKRSYYLEVRREFIKDGEFAGDQIINKVIWTDSRTLMVDGLPLSEMTDDQSYCIYIGCTDATQKWAAYSGCFYVTVKGDVVTLRSTQGTDDSEVAY